MADPQHQHQHQHQHDHQHDHEHEHEHRPPAGHWSSHDVQPTFMDDWRAGNACADDIAGYLAKRPDNDHRTPHTALGMTWAQYRRWVETGEPPDPQSTPATVPAQVRRPVRFNTQALLADVDDRRRRNRISWRAVASLAGLRNHSTVVRLGRGETPSLNSVVNLVMWLGSTDLGPYLIDVRPPDTGTDDR